MNKKKTFNLLLLAQSLSAFGDNAVYSVIMGMLLMLVKSGQMSLVEFGVASAIYANCLFLPYVLFAPGLGWISDHFTKRRVLIFANIIKAIGCSIGLAGVLTGHNLMILGYLVVGLGAAVYSPAKYGIIPELKTEEELVKANAAMEMTTIFSILIGIIGGGLLIDNLGESTSFLILVMVYFGAVMFNILMDESNISHKDERLVTAMKDFNGSLKTTFNKKFLYIPMLGTTIFWFSASFVKLNLSTWGQYVVKLDTATSIALLALWLSVGIIIGSFTAGRMFKTGQIRQSWIFGLGMGLAVLLMVVRYCNYYLMMGELVILGILGGLFLIPLNAAIQAKADLRDIGKIIAIQNFLENGSMLLSAGFFWYMNKLSWSSIITFVSIGGFLCLINVLWLRPALKKL
jgi:MFS transporter, LPLT family, lysophospholipid transporter